MLQPCTSQASYVRIHKVSEHLDETVCLKGWLYNKRSSGKLLFLQVRDGTGMIQCVVFHKDVSPELFEQAGHLTQESSLWLEGLVREDKRSPLGFELSVSNLGILHEASDYPISPKEHGTAFLMDHRHLWLRSSRQHAVLRVRAQVMRAIRDFLDGQGFTAIDAPIFTPNACEGTSNLFETNYFDTKAYLTQSGQLYMEAAAMAFGRVYCLGPTFRAEKSKTRRHLTEFWMVEPEMAFADLNEDISVAETMVSAIVKQVLTECKAELEVLERNTEALERIVPPFPRVTYDEAIALLHAQGRTDVQWGDDFGGDEETLISQQFSKPVFITHYPASIKPFYMKRDPENPEWVLNMDLIAPEGYGEMIGGSQREDDLAVLEAGIAEHKLPVEAFAWYADLRRYGSVPHAGFGLGIERTVAWICGLHHVRETIPFPRLMDRLSP